MNSDLVKFNIPPTFVLDRLVPTCGEMVYGFQHDWLAPKDVVYIATWALNAGMQLSKPEEELALLLSKELYRVPELIDELERVCGQEDNPAAVWLFLALAWLYEHRRDFDDPMETIEMLYADFGYPDEIQNLVRFMPAPDGTATGQDAIEARWRNYLIQKSMEYKARSV